MREHMEEKYNFSKLFRGVLSEEVTAEVWEKPGRGGR